MDGGESSVREELNQALRRVTPLQLQYVAARMYTTTDADAARLVGINPSVVSAWPNKGTINEAIRMMREITALSIVEQGKKKLEALVPRAVDVLGETLDREGARDRDRIVAAQAILNRTGLPATKDVRVAGHTTVDVTVKDVLAGKQKAAELEQAMGITAGAIEEGGVRLLTDEAGASDEDLAELDG